MVNEPEEGQMHHRMLLSKATLENYKAKLYTMNGWTPAAPKVKPPKPNVPEAPAGVAPKLNAVTNPVNKVQAIPQPGATVGPNAVSKPVPSTSKPVPSKPWRTKPRLSKPNDVTPL